jgi:hypothetical protein
MLEAGNYRTLVKKCVMKRVMICSVAKYYKIMKCKEGDLSTASNRYERKEKHKVCSEIYRKETAWKRRCGWDDYVKMSLNGREWDNVNLINLAKNSYQWWASVQKEGSM